MRSSYLCVGRTVTFVVGVLLSVGVRAQSAPVGRVVKNELAGKAP